MRHACGTYLVNFSVGLAGVEMASQTICTTRLVLKIVLCDLIQLQKAFYILIYNYKTCQETFTRDRQRLYLLKYKFYEAFLITLPAARGDHIGNQDEDSGVDR